VLARLLIASVLLVLVQAAFAQSTPPDAGDDLYRWREFVTSKHVEATVTGTVSGSTVSLSSRNPVFASVTCKVRSLLKFRDSLGASLESLVRKEYINNGLVLRNWYFKASGPITVRLEARGGLIQASIGGFAINTSFKAKQADLLYGKVNIHTNTVWLDGSYNPLTGKVSGLTLSPAVSIDIDVDAGGILKVLHIFQKKAFQIDIEDSVERSIRENIYSSLNELSSRETVVFGLNELLESGDFLYAGIDLGKKVRGLIKMLGGQSVTMTTTERWQTLRGTGELVCSSASQYEQAPQRLYLVGLDATISGGYAISVAEGVDTDFRPQFLETCGNVQYQ